MEESEEPHSDPEEVAVLTATASNTNANSNSANAKDGKSGGRGGNEDDIDGGESDGDSDPGGDAFAVSNSNGDGGDGGDANADCDGDGGGGDDGDADGDYTLAGAAGGGGGGVDADGDDDIDLATNSAKESMNDDSKSSAAEAQTTPSTKSTVRNSDEKEAAKSAAPHIASDDSTHFNTEADGDAEEKALRIEDLTFERAESGDAAQEKWCKLYDDDSTSPKHTLCIFDGEKVLEWSQQNLNCSHCISPCETTRQTVMKVKFLCHLQIQCAFLRIQCAIFADSVFFFADSVCILMNSVCDFNGFSVISLCFHCNFCTQMALAPTKSFVFSEEFRNSKILSEDELDWNAIGRPEEHKPGLLHSCESAGACFLSVQTRFNEVNQRGRMQFHCGVTNNIEIQKRNSARTQFLNEAFFEYRGAWTEYKRINGGVAGGAVKAFEWLWKEIVRQQCSATTVPPEKTDEATLRCEHPLSFYVCKDKVWRVLALCPGKTQFNPKTMDGEDEKRELMWPICGDCEVRISLHSV